MKNYAALLITLFYLALPSQAQIQISIPETPKKIEFANVVVNLDENMRKKIDMEVNALLTPPNSFLDAKLERMQWYFPIIERILDEEEVPDDLKYIAVMESSLVPEAVSTSNAVGYWQFKKATAEEVGIAINSDIDERRYIHASTRGAALYFKRNNLIFKNWISTMYSYNQGPTGAAAAIPSEWSYASEVRFDDNTPDYLIKALAHRIAFEHRLNRLKSSPRVFVEYPTSGKSLGDIAAELTVDISELRKYNSWLLSNAIPEGKNYTVLIPVRSEDVDAIKNKINQKVDFVKVDVGFPELKRTSASNVNSGDPILYEINGKKGILAEPGDEVAQLAKKADVKIFSFLKFNDMNDRDMVKTGQVYYLQKKSSKAKVPFHTVSGEQSLWDVSQMYGVRLKSLLKYNRLTSVQRLQPGRVVWMQKKRPKNKPVEIIKEAEKIEEPKKELPVKETYNEPIVQKTDTKSPVKPVIIEDEEDEEIEVETAPVVVKKTPPPPARVEPAPRKVIVQDDDIYGEPSTPATSGTYTSPKTKVSSSGSHRVAKGETLYSISKAYGVSVAQIREWNNMTAQDMLQYDQVLNVNGSSSSKITPSSTRATSSTHKVEAGETLYAISKKYDMTVEQLKQMNNLSENTISVGQSLNVLGNNSVTSKSSASTHTVKPGETLYSVSKKYNKTVDQVKAWNNLTSNNIYVGQILEIR